MRSLLAAFCVVAFCSAKSAALAEQPTAARELRLPATPFRYSELDLPDHIRRSVVTLDNTPRDNPITDHGATLGRVLGLRGRVDEARAVLEEGLREFPGDGEIVQRLAELPES